MDIAGYPVHVNDTAGLRDTADIIEQEGVKRATEVAGKSQVKVLVVDAEVGYGAAILAINNFIRRSRVPTRPSRTDTLSQPSRIPCLC